MLLTLDESVAWPQEIRSSPLWTEYVQQSEKKADSCCLFPDTVDCIKELKAKGLKIGVISNLSTTFKTPFFRLGLNELVDTWGFSCDLGAAKPDPKIFNLFNEKFQHVNPSSILFIGDSLSSDIGLAKNVGMRGILLDRNGVYKHIHNNDYPIIPDLKHISFYLSKL